MSSIEHLASIERVCFALMTGRRVEAAGGAGGGGEGGSGAYLRKFGGAQKNKKQKNDLSGGIRSEVCLA